MIIMIIKSYQLTLDSRLSITYKSVRVMLLMFQGFNINYNFHLLLRVLVLMKSLLFIQKDIFKTLGTEKLQDYINFILFYLDMLSMLIRKGEVNYD